MKPGLTPVTVDVTGTTFSGASIELVACVSAASVIAVAVGASVVCAAVALAVLGGAAALTAGRLIRSVGAELGRDES